MNEQARPSKAQIIVVGGGPGGSTAACYLAMKGLDVVLIEKDDFPRYRLGESLLPSTTPVLRDLGVLSGMDQAGFPRKTGGTFTWGKSNEPWSVLFSENPFLPSPFGYHVDRGRFDKILLDRAKSLGVRVIQPARVRKALIEDGRVVGVRYSDKSGTHELFAPFTIDASGPACVIGKEVTERIYDERMRQTSVHAYFNNVTGEPKGQEGHVIVTTCPKGWFWYIPMNSEELGQASVGLVTGQEFREELKEKGASGFFSEALQECPEIQTMLGEKAQQIGPTRSIKDWAFASKEMAGPGYFLVGDSAAFVDPLLSTGVTLAMLAAYSASVCINTVIQGKASEQEVNQFFQTNYARMYSVTRDCILYFYSANGLHGEEVFWKARKLMNFGDNIGAKQAFSHLVNTVAANPHPSARRQIHMFSQFMKNLEHPLEDMKQNHTLQEQSQDPKTFEPAELNEKSVLHINGEFLKSFEIDDNTHCLNPVSVIAYDINQPVFSSTSSWLLGRNASVLNSLQADLAERIDGKKCWETILNEWADSEPQDSIRERKHAAETIQELIQLQLIQNTKRKELSP